LEKAKAKRILLISPVINSLAQSLHNLKMNAGTRISVPYCGAGFQFHGQTQTAGNSSFAGCSRITSAKSHPWNEDASPITDTFQLRDEPVDTRSRDIFQMRSIPATNSPAENLGYGNRKRQSFVAFLGNRAWTISWNAEAI
jgi:hypothetical protein